MQRYTKIGNKYYTLQGREGNQRTLLTEISTDEITSRWGTWASGKDFNTNWNILKNAGEVKEFAPNSPEAQNFFNELRNSNIEVPSTIPQNTESVSGNPLQPSRTANPPTQTLGDVSGTDTSKKYIQYAGSPDVFDKSTGKYISADQAKAIPGFFSQVEKATIPRPEVKTGADYSKFSGKDITPTSGDGGPPGGNLGPTETIPSSDELMQKLKNIGLSDSTIQALGPQNQATFAALGEVMLKQYEMNNPVPQTFIADDLDKLLKQAQDSPDINRFYADQLKMGAKDLTQNLAQLQGDVTFQQKQQQQQMEQQRTQLAEQYAEKGAIYSGFANRAKSQLSEQQSGIIQSSRSQVQKELQGIGGAFEKQFGTEALKGITPINAGGQTYDPYGGVAGEAEKNKLLDIRAREQELQQTSALTRGLTK